MYVDVHVVCMSASVVYLKNVSNSLPLKKNPRLKRDLNKSKLNTPHQ